MDTKIASLLVCIAILPISSVFTQVSSEESTKIDRDQDKLETFISIKNNILKNIDDVKKLISKDLNENRNIAINNELNNVLHFSDSINNRINQFTPFIQNTRNIYKSEIITHFHSLLDNYDKLNEQIKQYINTLKESIHKPKFFRFLIEKKYDEALSNYNQIKDNSTLIEQAIIDLCTKREYVFDNLLEFISQINNITERAIIIRTMFTDCLLNNRFGKITVCKLLMLFDKLKTSKGIWDEENPFLILNTRYILHERMLTLITDINRKTYVNENISVVMEEFPFFKIRRGDKQWYNILYWLEETYVGIDKCNHAIGALSNDSPKNPPIA